ncbi:hypothetical protein [Longispora albida]|uniref:hypothetical protein n=1 Tax=Longispora albida TaxID=203523 RepID=UPI001FDFDC40|nr:hypothetical protein [Longispora albida]
MEEIAAWHNGLTGIDQMIVFVRRNPAGLCEVEVRTVEGSRLQELLTEANALALAAQIRKRARGRWERVLVPAEL